jgi:hypothetical protein
VVVIAFIKQYPEVLPLALNLVMFTVAAASREPGKSLYWLGASILTVGILMMKG